ncbi:hypothetical protein ASC97_29820 [Rhizobium sp. Root1203]|uniref:helix-turn-helix domain-containing protein n=1 Tax=Rhizobium sp. Root1203 TaxID=1736427 RepID=UPI00070A1F6B|nr:hypothetical protein ASC97_29820 [Rhizobium sp. Root1203]
MGSFLTVAKRCSAMASSRDIGKSIRELRKARRLTQRSLGELVDRSEDAISQIERGVNIPTIETLASISSALGVSLDQLMHADDGMISDERARLLSRANSILATLPDNHLAIALEQISLLAKLNKN